MLPKALLAAALASSTASAFLLPPPTDVVAENERERGGHHRHHGGKNRELIGDVNDVSDTRFHPETPGVSMASPFYHEFTKVKVPCPGCSMQIRKHGHGDKGEGEVVTLTDVENHINLFFKIDHQADGDHLLVNHFEVYPNVDINNDGLMATQAPDHFHHKMKHHKEHDEEKKEHEEKHDDEEKHGHDGHEEELKKRHRKHRKHRKHDDDDADEKDGFEGKHWKHKADAGRFDNDFRGKKQHEHHGHGKHLVKVPLGYALQTQAVGQDESNGMAVVGLSLEIIQVNGEFIKGIPAVNIRLIRTPEGGLMIARVDLEGAESSSEIVASAPAKDPMAALKEQLDACSNILCRWKAIISSSIKAHHHGCGGKAKAKAMAEGEEDEEKPHRHHHHHHHEEGSEDSEDSETPRKHKHHAHKHSWTRLARKFASHILFPVLLGVVAGIAVAVVGMAVGSVMIGLWRFVARKNTKTTIGTRARRSSKSKVAAAERHANEAAVDEEKAGLMSASTEDLPQYKDDETK